MSKILLCVTYQCIYRAMHILSIGGFMDTSIVVDDILENGVHECFEC